MISRAWQESSRLKRWVFRRRWKMTSDGADCRRPFQIRRAVTGKAQSLTIDSHIQRTISDNQSKVPRVCEQLWTFVYHSPSCKQFSVCCDDEVPCDTGVSLWKAPQSAALPAVCPVTTLAAAVVIVCVIVECVVQASLMRRLVIESVCECRFMTISRVSTWWPTWCAAVSYLTEFWSRSRSQSVKLAPCCKSSPRLCTTYTLKECVVVSV